MKLGLNGHSFLADNGIDLNAGNYPQVINSGAGAGVHPEYTIREV
jgi:hypothetical protein